MLDSSDKNLQKLGINIVSGIGGKASLHTLSYQHNKKGYFKDMDIYMSVILAPTIGDAIIVKRRKRNGTSEDDRRPNKVRNSRKRRTSPDTSEK